MPTGSEADPQPNRRHSCFVFLGSEDSTQPTNSMSSPWSHPATLSPTPHPQCPQIPLALPSWGSGNPHGSPTAASPGWPSRLIPPRPALSRPPCLLPHISHSHPLSPRGLRRTWLVHPLPCSDAAMAPALTAGSWPRTGPKPCLLLHPQTHFLDSSQSLSLLWLCPENVFWNLP